MAIIHDLITQIDDESLRTRILQEINKLSHEKKFGLVFEEHLPECTPLYDIRIKKGDKVAVKDLKINNIYIVLDIKEDTAICTNKQTRELCEFPLNSLVVVSEFGDAIFPYLEQLDCIENNPGSNLWNILIESDNYHALQLLQYLYFGKIDCIYIDPPYNNGVSEWKYNNNIIDNNDEYKHSKWLSMMQKRLVLAKRLLNPSSSVLIVTIDDKEYLHLGCLLEEIFPSSKITMISSVINPAGKAKKGGTDFSKTDEYIFFVQIGNCPVLPETREITKTPIAWETLRRHSLANGRGKHGVGACGPNQFYPIYVNDKTKKIIEIGEPIKEDVSRFSVKQIEGCTAVFPVRDNGIEMNWGVLKETALELIKKGYLRVGQYSPEKPQQYSIQYLTKGTIKSIENGEVIITGRDLDGSIMGYFPTGKPKMPTTNWNKISHNATSHGTDLINKIFVGSRFDYPKSIYAVLDCLKIFLADKKDAIVLDFFAGSGTTLHAVNLLNASDGGRRQCIMVTNNEVSKAEEKILRTQGYYPGDRKWNELGIARYVTWPRTKCSILGIDINGNPLKGVYGVEREDYIQVNEDTQTKNTYKKTKIQMYPELSDIKLADGFKSNAIFYKLGFLDKTAIELGRQFEELIPVLWIKAGAVGKCPILDNHRIPDMMICPDNKMAILIKESVYFEFCNKIDNLSEIETIYFVTDSDAAYKEMIKPYYDRNCLQLYRDYLDNFRINVRRK